MEDTKVNIFLTVLTVISVTIITVCFASIQDLQREIKINRNHIKALSISYDNIVLFIDKTGKKNAATFTAKLKYFKCKNTLPERICAYKYIKTILKIKGRIYSE